MYNIQYQWGHDILFVSDKRPCHGMFWHFLICWKPLNVLNSLFISTNLKMCHFPVFHQSNSSSSSMYHLLVLLALIISESLLLKSQMGPFCSSCIFFTFIYSIHIEMCSSPRSHNTPQYIPIACPQAFCPKGSWDTNTPWGCCFHSLWEKHSRERRAE